jgi:hypothetical protein
MRDLNRKGAEKEGGSDMDAFTEPSPEETLPLMPSPVSPSSQPLVPATPNKVTDNQIVKVSVRTWIYLSRNSLLLECRLPVAADIWTGCYAYPDTHSKDVCAVPVVCGKIQVIHLQEALN